MSRLPLRARVTVWFGLIFLLLTSTLTSLTWLLSTEFMIDQREEGAIRQAMVNGRLVDASIARGSTGLDELITGLGADVESAVLLVDQGTWISSGNLVDPKRLPRALLAEARDGHPVHQRTTIDGIPVLAVGLPLPTSRATYVQVFPLRDLDRAFRFLSWTLVIGTAAGAVLGAALGRWVGTLALRPLRKITAAAAAAVGDPAVRLPTSRDPELARLATAFNDNGDRLRQRAIRDARFAGDVSHELRSPLTTMINAMAVLRRRSVELPDSAQQPVRSLDADLRRFRRMVNDLIEISRSDEAPERLNFELLDLTVLVRQAAAEHRHELHAEVPGRTNGPVVMADRRCLERAVANLIDNAERHGRGLTRLAVFAHAGTARIEVDDAGPGVPASAHERIFERFSRCSPTSGDETSGDGAGSGLGLALVAQYVQAHHGQVCVVHRPGGGARFIVELPEAPP